MFSWFLLTGLLWHSAEAGWSCRKARVTHVVLMPRRINEFYPVRTYMIFKIQKRLLQTLHFIVMYIS
jgi:hypothetical protein